VIVHTVHGFGFHAFQPAAVRGGFQQLERATSRITDGLIVVSEHDRQTGLALGIGRPAQYRLIRYGIEAGRFESNGAPQSARSALGIAPEEPVVGTVACFKPQKGPLDFIRACQLVKQQVPDAHFLMVGDGELRPEVERLGRRLGLDGTLHLVGWCEDVPQWLGAMDVFVLASRWEGLPIACLEAMASGLPVVGTTAGGIPELIRHGHNGLLVPIGEPHRLSEAVVRLLRDEEARRAMGARSGQLLDGQFTVERMVRETEQFYEELLEQREGSTR
jgi:glycosyltransferase involved in cell wall biosynthesis